MAITSNCANRRAHGRFVFWGLVALLLITGCGQTNTALINVSTDPLPGGVVSVGGQGTYSATLSANGGAAPYTWALTSAANTLPPGLVLNSAGIITGSPAAAGTYSFTVQVTDSQGHSNAAKLRIYIYKNV